MLGVPPDCLSTSLSLMAIEVTSVPDQRRFPSWRSLARAFHAFSHKDAGYSKRHVFIRSVCSLLAIALLAGGDSLVNSYKYHSRLVDARLASGYLTSRPGLYAAPRIIQRGQKMSVEALVRALRRAGYVESGGSNVFSGSFRNEGSAIEIRPTHANDARPPIVNVIIDHNDRISDLTSEGASIESFTLEPEVLSNDLFSKGR